MIPLGHVLTQAPHAVHLSWSTSGIPVTGFSVMAPKVHASTQSPCPRQPYTQAVSPPYNAASTAQDEAPL